MIAQGAAYAFLVFVFGGSILLVLYVPIHFSRVEYELIKAPYKTKWPHTIHFVGPLEPCRFEPYHHYMTAQSTIRKQQLGFFSKTTENEFKKRLYQVGGFIL